MKIISAFLSGLLAFTGVYSQPFAKWSDTELVLNNGLVQRIIRLPGADGNFITTSYKPVKGAFDYFVPVNTDFQLEANGVSYSGLSKWTMKGISSFKDKRQGDGASVTLLSADKKIELTIRFLLYPGLPVVRKSLLVKNLSAEEISLESVDIEKFSATAYWASTFSWIYSNYGRRNLIGSYKGNMQDALMVVHNIDWQAGMVIGNEATGILKRSTAFWDTNEICAGLTHKDDRYPFRKWLKANETFETPQVFTMVYNEQKDPSEIMNKALPDFIRKHMGIRLSELKEKPTFIYNTWMPFKDDINEKLVMELAKAAAEAGMKEFIIDDGWQDSYGDWGIDKKKFPNGLKPVFDYIKSLGMKPGLWISVGSASSKSRVFKEHPEWFVRDKNNQFANLTLESDVIDIQSACFSTGWKEYIAGILKKLALEYGLEYMKLDFSVVSSPYIFNKEKTGCYSASHPGHKDHHESFYVNYQRMWELFDELHMVSPDLFMDCTFETMGGLQLIDYAVIQHAEGIWLSNFSGNAGPVTDLRVRNMSWWRSPAMPATALVIGNPEMQDKGWPMHIKSLAGALPIMLGDPRKLSKPDFAQYRIYADWLQLMEKRHEIMSFRQDLPGFTEPAEGSWDGFQRINTETGMGGIIGVFRHGAIESRRRVTINYLDPSKMYQVTAMDGKPITRRSGKELQTTGFELTFNELYTGELFEVSAVK